MMSADLPLHFEPSLYLVIGRSDVPFTSMEYLVRQAVEGGVTLVQLREKTASDEETIALAKNLKALLDTYHIPLIINDRINVAKQVSAAGVHLGQEDISVKEARSILGSNAIIGFSVGGESEIDEQAIEVADYVAIGPVFATSTKPDAGPALGLAEFGRLRKLIAKPVVAIGGITDDKAKDVIKSGADGIAVVSAICRASDPKREAQKLLSLIQANI